MLKGVSELWFLVKKYKNKTLNLANAMENIKLLCKCYFLFGVFVVLKSISPNFPRDLDD